MLLVTNCPFQKPGDRILTKLGDASDNATAWGGLSGVGNRFTIELHLVRFAAAW